MAAEDGKLGESRRTDSVALPAAVGGAGPVAISTGTLMWPGFLEGERPLGPAFRSQKSPSGNRCCDGAIPKQDQGKVGANLRERSSRSGRTDAVGHVPGRAAFMPRSTT